MIRNLGEDNKMLGEGFVGNEDQQGCPNQDGPPNQVDFEYVLKPRSNLC